MSTKLPKSSPQSFNLSSFADLLAPRSPIVGEDPGGFAGFRDGLLSALAPMTPYEWVIAENLIAIEWEIVQHRQMRDAGLRTLVMNAIRSAVKSARQEQHNEALDEAWDRHLESGGDEDYWENPFEYDEEAANVEAEALAHRAISRDLAEQAAAYAAIRALGRDPLDLMGDAYRSYEASVTKHEDKLPDLEKRRHEVKRDFDTLQASRPIEAAVMDG